jgi:hypothetical protein
MTPREEPQIESTRESRRGNVSFAAFAFFTHCVAARSALRRADRGAARGEIFALMLLEHRHLEGELRERLDSSRRAQIHELSLQFSPARNAPRD